MKKYFILLLILFCAGCGTQVDVSEAATPTDVIATSTLPASQTPSPSQTPLPPLSTPTVDPVRGTIITQVNVRSGPGTSFNSLGLLNAQDPVTLTGKDANGAWLQIDFAQGPEGKGWVNAAFVQADRIESLPIVSSDNVIAGTGTPTGIPSPSAPTIHPALADGDSVVAPAINIALTSAGTRSFQYSSDVSSPEGDAEDWMQFTTFTPVTSIRLECEGSESYIAELLQNNLVVQNLVCGRIILVHTLPDAVYTVHFQSSPAGGLQYTSFTLRVEAIP